MAGEGRAFLLLSAPRLLRATVALLRGGPGLEAPATKISCVDSTGPETPRPDRDRCRMGAGVRESGWRTSRYSRVVGDSGACVQAMTVWLTGESGTGFPGVPARASRPATDARLTSAPAASAGHVASAGPAQRSWLSLSAADQRHDWTAAAHPGAAEVTSAASGPRELTPDYHSVEELISDLRSSARWSSVSPLPATLSPDLFGLLEDVPPPPFLEGHDYSDLSAGRSIGFLRALDMVKPTPPSHADMEPAALTDHADRVEVIERSDAERTSWAPETHYCFEPNEQIRIRPLPRTSVMPWILFSIWLGGPLGTSGKMGDFRQTFGAANAEIETGLFADKILLTDVPRSSFEQARHIGSSSPESADQFGEVRSMLEWAEQNDIMLVNVKEVFNAAYPMRLGSHFLTEMNKQTPPGCAAASDILRLNFLYRFGGVYSDGDNIVSHLIDVPDVVKSANGFSVYADGRGNVGNMLIVASKEHPFVGEYIEEISRQYELPQSWMIIPSKQLPKSSDGGGMRARRHSVMNRTGPGILHNVLENHGYNVRYDIVQLMGIEIGHANSWLRGPLDAKSGSGSEIAKILGPFVDIEDGPKGCPDPYSKPSSQPTRRSPSNCSGRSHREASAVGVDMDGDIVLHRVPPRLRRTDHSCDHRAALR